MSRVMSKRGVQKLRKRQKALKEKHLLTKGAQMGKHLLILQGRVLYLVSCEFTDTMR